MNNKFGPDNLYRDERYPRANGARGSAAREHFWRDVDADRTLRSPDQEFETSGDYREPKDDFHARPMSVGVKPARASGGFRGRGPKGYLRTDERIREDVCDRLSWNEEVDATEITVLVDNGEVTLEGRVATRHMKRVAEDVSENVPGVGAVHNTLRVTTPLPVARAERPTGTPEPAHDPSTGATTGAADDASTSTGDGM